ncbi:MAG: nucleotide exchange factor GrpE [Sedimentisphaerales bacterium]|nr:nucleotide exchange factor GrpE [Sedimentisphaerales bacterium]
MLKKCAILGLMLLLIGGLALAWVRSQTRSRQLGAHPQSVVSGRIDRYPEMLREWYKLPPEQQNQLVLELDKERQDKTQEQLAEEQQARLARDLDRLAAGEMNGGDIADFLYGANWQEKVLLHKKQKEQEQIAQTVSAVCLSIGGVLFVGCVLIWILISIVRGFRALARRHSQPTVTNPPEGELTEIMHEEPQPDEPQETDVEAPAPGRRKLPAGWQLAGEAASPLPSFDAEDAGDEHFLPRRYNPTPTSRRPTLALETCTDEGNVAVLMSDEPAPSDGWSPETQWAAQAPPEEEIVTPPQRQRFTPRPKVTVLDVEQTVAETDHTLEEQADDLQKQIAEFKEVAQSVQQANRSQTEPINSTLKELTQQVSAIREYAASQQDRVEKLQDGYDWTIIRTFCLRVIRCIDNIETRIDKLADGNGSVTHLEEVKDELLFALESSGVEQFRPDINSDFRGQEKFAEAIKDKQPAKKPDQAGKIAKVIRPGYRYIVDDDSYKVVRTAQVKLFG